MLKNNSNQAVKIRKMDMSDVPFVFQCETTIFHQTINEKAMYEEIIENYVSKYYMATINGKKVGYIGGWMPRPNAEIITIYIKNEYRKQNIGSMLLDHLLKTFQAHNVESVTLEVRISNTAAIALYESFGFEVVACRKNYYKDGEDAHVMYYMIGGNV